MLRRRAQATGTAEGHGGARSAARLAGGGPGRERTAEVRRKQRHGSRFRGPAAACFSGCTSAMQAGRWLARGAAMVGGAMVEFVMAR